MTKPKAIPAAALGRRLAFVGTTGSGKTYAAKGGVERKLAARERVVIIDPLDVWWGLALNVDGKTASPHRSDTVAGTSQQIVIFGGKHADMQITENGGKLLGEAVATAKESCIISLGGLRTEASRRRFMVGFLDALYEHTDPEISEPYTLVVDEADLFAPQKPFGGHAEMLLHLMEEIVRRGRVRGFLPWLISQRPAIVNKNVLSQVDGMVAMQLTGAHDRGAIEAWIEGHADKRETKELLASLATFQQGTGLVWVPRDGLLETMTFPANHTFDSSRTPKRGEKKKAHKLRALNLGKLKDMLASVEAETKANDPTELRKLVAGLQAQLRKVKAPPAAPAIDAVAWMASLGNPHVAKDTVAFLADASPNSSAYQNNLGAMRTAGLIEYPSGGMLQLTESGTALANPPADAPTHEAVMAKIKEKLAPAQMRIVQTAADRYPNDWTKDELAQMIGASATSSAFQNNLGRLRTLGLITYPASGRVRADERLFP